MKQSVSLTNGQYKVEIFATVILEKIYLDRCDHHYTKRVDPNWNVPLEKCTKCLHVKN